jgi:Transposase and inactivated derivatives
MPAFIIPNRSQMLLLTQVDLSTVAPEGSAVAIINDLVDSLDTRAIEESYEVDSDNGRPPFHPKTLLKVALLALHSCRFSLRKMEKDTINNLAYKWLTGDMTIDHSTMGLFLARFAGEIVELFSQVVASCAEQNLIEFDLLAIDSVKLRANANYKQSKTLEGIKKEENKIAQRLKEVLATASDDKSAEEEEVLALKRRAERVREAKKVLLERLAEKSREASAKKKQELIEKEKVNITDPDAHIMQQANGEKNPAFSITTTTDVGHDIVTHFQVNAEDNDAAALPEAIEGSRRSTGEKHREVEADAGFASMENYEKLELEEQEALIPDRRMDVEENGTTAKGEYDRSKFSFRANSDSYRCPCGWILSNTGSVEINGRIHDRYENPSACARCAYRNRCTKGTHRRVFRDRNEEVRERMRTKLDKKRSQGRYNKRAHTAESPFGNLKWNLKFRAVMRRGIRKVRMEAALLFMLHNFMKMAPAPG